MYFQLNPFITELNGNWLNKTEISGVIILCKEIINNSECNIYFKIYDIEFIDAEVSAYIYTCLVQFIHFKLKYIQSKKTHSAIYIVSNKLWSITDDSIQKMISSNNEFFVKYIHLLVTYLESIKPKSQKRQLIFLQKK